MLTDETRVVVAGDEIGVVHQAKMEREVGRNTRHDVFRQRAAHSFHGLSAGGCPHGKLAHQRVVVGGDGRPFVRAGVVAHAGSSRYAQHLDGAGARQEAGSWILRVHATLDGVTAPSDVRLAVAEGLTRSHAHLLSHQIDAGNELGDGMLHLQACVHLQEVEVPIFAEEELHRAGSLVIHRLGGFDGDLAHPRHQRIAGCG